MTAEKEMKTLGWCKAKIYTDNSPCLMGAIVCCGFPKDEGRCKYYEDCLKYYGIKLSKNGRRIRTKEISNAK